MTRKRSPHDWTDFDWGAFAAGDASRLIAVLPLAATEQHGPHLPLGTDVMIGEAYLARVRELLPQAIAGALSARAAGGHLDRASSTFPAR